MAQFELQGPDGKVYEVEADDAQQAVSAFGQMFKDSPAEQPRASYGEGLGRTLAQGATLGAADELTAAVSSARPYRGPVGSGRSAAAQPVNQESRAAYDETLANERRIVSQFAQDNPKTAIAAQIAGGVATAPLAPVAQVFRGARIGNSAITGAGYGAVAGFNSGEGQDRVENALVGTGAGAFIGGFAPVVGTAAGNALASIRNRMSPLPPQVAQFERPAVNRLAQIAERSGTTPQQFQARAQELGPRGMIADMDGAFTDVTEAIAQQPGRQRQIIEEALTNRQQTAPDEIRGAITQNMGPAANIPRTVEMLERTYGQQAAPLYDQFYQTVIPNTPQLGVLYQRAEASGAVRNAARLMEIDGFDPAALRAQQLTGREWDYIKRGVDDMAGQADRAGSREGVRRFGNLARDIRGQVDLAISPNAPAQSVWAQARGIAGDGIGAREAIEEGRTAFNRGLSADQLEADMAGRSGLERTGYTTGAREQLRSTMDNAATNFGPRGDVAARRMLNSPENRRKMEVMIGPNDTRNITRTIDAENAMAETNNQVLANSATARRQAGRDVVPRQYDQSNMREVRNSSVSGLAMEAVSRMGQILTAGALNERNARIATDMARMLVSQGVARDDIIRGLQSYAQRQGVTQQQRARLEDFVQRLVRSTTPAAALQDGQ